MCIRGLEECREKGEGAGVPEARRGAEPRKDTNGHDCHPPVDWIRCLSACVRAMDFRVFRGSGIQLPPSAPSL